MAENFTSRMASIVGMDRPPSVSARRLLNGQFVATRLIVPEPPKERTGGLSPDQAFVVAVAMEGGYSRERWVDGKAQPTQGLHGAGAVSMMDLRSKNEVRFLSPINTIHFHFPIEALDFVADSNELARGHDIHTKLASFCRDAVFAGLARSLLSSFIVPDDDMPLFVDHLMTAAALHLLTTHCGSAAAPLKHTGGLAPWQQRKVEEMADCSPGAGLSMEALATACGLSIRHFTRAFSQTNGVPPYQWLLRRRMATAKTLLRETTQSIDEIAVHTGFASRSHFTRVFSSFVGQSPAAWRRAMGATPTIYT